MTDKFNCSVSYSKNINKSGHFGGGGNNGDIVGRGKCPYCSKSVAFRQVETGDTSSELGASVSVMCDSCMSHLTVSYDGDEFSMHPSPDVESMRYELPEIIDKYYQEAIDCMSAECPNGAATLFRKTIHAVGIHYGITERGEAMGIYDIIKELEGENQINEGTKEALLAVKDIGADGAHINENEPDMEQINEIKDLVDGMLLSTVVRDKKVSSVREESPNEYT